MWKISQLTWIICNFIRLSSCAVALHSPCYSYTKCNDIYSIWILYPFLFRRNLTCAIIQMPYEERTHPGGGQRYKHSIYMWIWIARAHIHTHRAYRAISIFFSLCVCAFELPRLIIRITGQSGLCNMYTVSTLAHTSGINKMVNAAKFAQNHPKNVLNKTTKLERRRRRQPFSFASFIISA